MAKQVTISIYKEQDLGPIIIYIRVEKSMNEEVPGMFESISAS